MLKQSSYEPHPNVEHRALIPPPPILRLYSARIVMAQFHITIFCSLDMLGPPALLNNTHSKSCFLIHEPFPTNIISFQELVNFGITYLPLPFLNPTIYLASNPTSTNLISSPYLLNFPFSLSSFVRALL